MLRETETEPKTKKEFVVMEGICLNTEEQT